MQSETMDISNACKLLEHCQTFITGYRDTGYTSAIITAKQIARETETELDFRALRIKKKEENIRL